MILRRRQVVRAIRSFDGSDDSRPRDTIHDGQKRTRTIIWIETRVASIVRKI